MGKKEKPASKHPQPPPPKQRTTPTSRKPNIVVPPRIKAFMFNFLEKTDSMNTMETLKHAICAEWNDTGFTDNYREFLRVCRRNGISEQEKWGQDMFDRAYAAGFIDPVPTGQHIDYASRQQIPYEAIVTNGYPQSGRWGQVDKVVPMMDRMTEFALKRIFRFVSSVDGLTKRIEREVTSLKALSHPHVVALKGTFTWRDDYYLLLYPFIDATLLDMLKKDEIVLSKNMALNWLVDLSGGLAYIHDRKVVHRDIKPENILVRRPDGYILFADFGFARTFSTAGSSASAASVGGSEIYMAPEQYEKEKYSRRVDVFALGGVFFDILAKGNGLALDQLRGIFTDLGDRSCPLQIYACYRHNDKIMHSVSKQFKRDDGVGRLVDFVRDDMLQQNSTFRSSAANVYKNMVRGCQEVKGFTKSKCCDVVRTNYQDASFKQMEQMFARLNIGGNDSGVSEQGATQLSRRMTKEEIDLAIRQRLGESKKKSVF